MISRRTIRIKALQILYSYYSSPERSLEKSEKELFFSISKTYDLYHHLMGLLVEIADFAHRKIETNLTKFQPTYEDLHPNTKFVDNKVIQQLRNNRRLKDYLNKTKLSWVNHQALVKELYGFLTETEFYREYMAQNETSYFEERRLVEKIFQNVILISEDLHQVLEEESIYWNDDIDAVVAMIVKTIRDFNEHTGENQPLLPKFKDNEDELFTKDLFRKSIINQDELRGLIELHSSNWDIERIAFMDTLIMQLAMAEFIYFPSIPTKVTLNEYIELSKYYSTDKSRNFINGILDNTLKELKLNNKVNKTGRGLIGENR